MQGKKTYICKGKEREKINKVKYRNSSFHSKHLYACTHIHICKKESMHI